MSPSKPAMKIRDESVDRPTTPDIGPGEYQPQKTIGMKIED
jgi:hypothetical protein